MLKGDKIRLQPWFIIRRVSCLYTGAHSNACHKDYKGDWPHRGLLHSFWWCEILVWNLVFICPGGHFGHGYVIPFATRRMVQSSLQVQDGVSFFFKMESAWPALSSLRKRLSFSHWMVFAACRRQRCCLLGWVLILRLKPQAFFFFNDQMESFWMLVNAWNIIQTGMVLEFTFQISNWKKNANWKIEIFNY